MSKAKIFIWMEIFFALGILAASAFEVERRWVYVALAATVAGFALSYYGGHKRSALALLLLFCAGLGAIRLWASMVPNQYQYQFGAKQKLEGYVMEEPALKTKLQTLVFLPAGFKQDILITTDTVQQFSYGDLIVVEGAVAEAKNYGDFDYQKYLERFNIYATISYPKILILKSGQLNPAKQVLLKIKAAFVQRLAQFLKEPQFSLAIGIIIGGHGNLPQNIIDDFSKTGVSHIIAVSGFNITIIVTAVVALAYVLGRRMTFWLGLLTIISFVVITGATASVVRAAIMGFLMLIAVRLGRQYAIAPSLFFAGFLMLLFNPKILFWDVGFQLSFAATLGIVYFFPVLDRLFATVPEDWGIKSLVLTTTAAIVATLPLIVFNFGVLSLSAPVVNILVLPMVPLTMLFGFLAIVPVLGAGFAWIANGLLTYILSVVSSFGELRYGSLSLQIPVWVFWLMVLSVFGIYFLLRRWAGQKKARAFD